MKGNFKHGMYGTPTYKSWAKMIERCTNPKAIRFERYGARGIGVCDRWKNFQNFIADMGERKDGTSLDRIDNNKGYEPGNCRWATSTEQARNRSVTRLMTVNGATKPVAEWAAIAGVSRNTLIARIDRYGMTHAQAVTHIKSSGNGRSK